MGKVQRDLLAQAQRLTVEQLARRTPFAAFWDELTVLLCGSAVTEYADAYSGIDLLVLAPEPQCGRLRQALVEAGLECPPGTFRELSLDSRRVLLAVRSLEEARAELERYEDFAMATYPRAAVLHDPKGRHALLVAGIDGYPQEVLQARIADRYRRLRRRQASLAWNVRRGQPFVLLDNLVQFLDHALSLCFLLQGEPPAGRKWLFQGALRTETGKALRPLLLDLFSALGAVATLGGSGNLRDNAIYRRVAAIQQALEEAIRAAGVPLDGAAE